MSGFLEIQTATGWGNVLQSFADWCHPEPGSLTLDIGTGPGLLPAILEQRGFRSFGVDYDQQMFVPAPLYKQVALASAFYLPFPGEQFNLVTASNLLFLLQDPLPALKEMRRVLAVDGHVTVLNPSEQMSVQAAESLADRRNLEGVARQSLVNWAQRAETGYRWGEADLAALFSKAGLHLVRSELRVGPGLARLASASRG